MEGSERKYASKSERKRWCGDLVSINRPVEAKSISHAHFV